MQEARGQAVACCKLGAIRFAQGGHDLAVGYYERAFELARGLADRKLLDTIRTNLGIVRAAANDGAYMQVRARIGVVQAGRGLWVRGCGPLNAAAEGEGG